MSGFIANGSASTEAPIENDGFWPPIDPVALRQRIRLDGSIASERLRAAVVNAVITVNDELPEWKAKQLAGGYAALRDVPAPSIDGTSRLVQLYLRAVTCAAAAEVAERYRSYDATAAGNQRADDLSPSIDELRRDMRWAIRDLKATPRMTVELI
ncbi:head completion/stabilization protein [Lysobacter sp. Root604]|uniref:head completion/stabilization protein n=1 Tax=Lysobacter sp. Root604 TaxID=1736568 RepID=UPI0006F422C9|nr:head completion/stabilization protein [Lysobacter sp. Root604]KRA15348.1 head completion/stabilization protein [Lysobacter sp. Root604]